LGSVIEGAERGGSSDDGALDNGAFDDGLSTDADGSGSIIAEVSTGELCITGIELPRSSAVMA
jgi:hypothetical protein